jgi:The GLUG motif
MCTSVFGFRIALAFLLAFVGVSQAQYSGGSGTPDDPFQIWTVDDWVTLMSTPADWSKQFVLTADLDLKDITVSPVGSYIRHFTGIFDGNGHVIRNAVIQQPGNDYVGLFGYLGQNGEIFNLRIDARITGHSYVGGLVGKNSNGNLLACSASGLVEATGYYPRYVGGLVGHNDHGVVATCSASNSVNGGTYIGGLVGTNSGGSVTACSATGSVSGSDYVGGLIGSNSQAPINDCNATGALSGHSYVGGLVGNNADGNLLACSAAGTVELIGYYPQYAGGLVGRNDQGFLTACSASGSVSGGNYAGGLVGINSGGSVTACSATGSVGGVDYVGGLIGGNSQATINDSYATGSVNGRSYVGGLLGDTSAGGLSACYSVARVAGTGSYVSGLAGHDSGSVESRSCFWDIETSGQTTSALGTGKTTDEMKTRSTFTSAGWDFLDETENGIAETWTILDGIDYPRLCWKVYYRIAYAPNPPDGADYLDPNVTLSWIPGVTAGRHDVYFGDNFDDVNDGLAKVSDSNQTEPNFTVGQPGCPYPDGLVPRTTYYWRVDEVNDADPASPWKGPVWSFTIAQKKAYNPVPADGAAEVDPNVVLTWEPGYGAQSHTVFFGEHFNDVNSATDGIAREPNAYVPGELDSRKTYYWRVDEFDGSGNHKGDVWSFTVRPYTKICRRQVSASEDDGYAFNQTGLNLETPCLRVGASKYAQPPYYMACMLFRDVSVPQGARIVSAYLKIRSCDTQLTDELYGTIQAEDTDNAAIFDQPLDIADRPKTGASCDWDHVEPWSPDTWYESPDIVEVIQEVINRDGWSEGNSLAIFYSTRQRKGGYRQFSSYDRGVDYAPMLEIVYEP